MPTEKQGLSTIILPNGQEIFYLNRGEVNSLYNEIDAYFHHHIVLKEGDTIVDVGANIGIFSLYISEKYHQQINIYAFEPIPSVYAVLEQNFKKINSEKLKAINCGLLNVSKEVEFTFFPNITELSTAFPERWKKDLEHLKVSFYQNIEKSPYYYDEKDDELPEEMKERVRYLRSMFGLKKVFNTETVKCKVITLSEFIEEYRIPQIDLLKVDVEKSEEEVFAGIKNNDWPKIKQIVTEIHEKTLLEKLINLFKSHGFNLIDKELAPTAEGVEFYTIYAGRDQ